MDDLGSNLTRLADRMRAELAGNRKKLAVLAVLTVTFCALLAYTLAGGPSSAGAAAAGPAVAEATGGLQGLLGNATGTSDKWASTRRNEITRDLFAVNVDHFPPDQSVSTVTTVVKPSRQDVEKAEKRAELQLVQAQARALSLQTTVVSSDPTAILNGRVLRIGDWISGFKMVEITPRSCTLEKSGTRVVLEMQN